MFFTFGNLQNERKMMKIVIILYHKKSKKNFFLSKIALVMSHIWFIIWISYIWVTNSGIHQDWSSEYIVHDLFFRTKKKRRRSLSPYIWTMSTEHLVELIEATTMYQLQSVSRYLPPLYHPNDKHVYI